MPFVKGSLTTKKGGRPKKVDEMKINNISIQAITERYGGLKEGFLALLESKEPSLIKFVFEHAAGKPKEKMEVDMNKDVETIQIIQLPSNNRPSPIQDN